MDYHPQGNMLTAVKNNRIPNCQIAGLGIHKIRPTEFVFHLPTQEIASSSTRRPNFDGEKSAGTCFTSNPYWRHFEHSRTLSASNSPPPRQHHGLQLALVFTRRITRTARHSKSIGVTKIVMHQEEDGLHWRVLVTLVGDARQSPASPTR